MSQKIYTKTGDKGVTSLIGGAKVPKSHLRIESYGNVDELNSYIGLLSDYITDRDIKNILLRIQNNLFVIGSLLAQDDNKDIKMKLPGLYEKDITQLELQIDAMSEELPQLTNFILPGGHILVSCIHISRSICRRTERSCVLLQEQQLYVQPIIIQYLNRLSDYLFILARFIGKQLNIEEVIWKGE